MFLILGSCRVTKLFESNNDAICYAGGHVHSTSEVVQAFQLMNSEMMIPNNILSHMKRGRKAYPTTWSV